MIKFLSLNFDLLIRKNYVNPINGLDAITYETLGRVISNSRAYLSEYKSHIFIKFFISAWVNGSLCILISNWLLFLFLVIVYLII